MNLCLEFRPRPHNADIFRALEKRYSIVEWHGHIVDEDVLIVYNDQRLITMFLLEWT